MTYDAKINFHIGGQVHSLQIFGQTRDLLDFYKAEFREVEVKQTTTATSSRAKKKKAKKVVKLSDYKKKGS